MQQIMKQRSDVQEKVDRFLGIKNALEEYLQLAQMAQDENTSDTQDILSEVKISLKQLMHEAKKFEVECLFSGQYDKNNCFLDINAGAGGTESHDWASIMMRMYLRFAERMKFKTEIIHMLDGEEAGIKSCTIRIIGHNAYGWFKTESGVHRLVRISPFNAAGKRMTSFASAFVYPEVEEDIQIAIDEKDLRIDTYRASGAGGQHVNKTDSAVRITHIPSGIVVQSQSDRSQHKNKADCMKMLKSKLYEVEIKKKQDAIDSQNSQKTEIGWGHQIRSYVLQPYQMVKDLRTDVETSNTQAVLDGDLENFVYASLSNCKQ